MCRLRCIEHPDDLQLDTRRQHLEEPAAATEKHRDLGNLHLVQHAGLERTLLRLQAALPLLATGEPVATVARRVGYDTGSAFVEAFHRETGLTPGSYFGPGS